MTCRFCGGDGSEPNHRLHCDGRQGALEFEPLYGAMGDVPFETGSDTSAQAAQALADDDLSRLETVVFNMIAARPRTCDAIEAATGLAHQTVSARIRGLVLRNRVIDAGRRELTRHRRWAVVWRPRTSADDVECA
jgi:predicted Rossmann fold nucleotide-binding protein DprA/Smf involved in DNA uptake